MTEWKRGSNGQSPCTTSVSNLLPGVTSDGGASPLFVKRGTILTIRLVIQEMTISYYSYVSTPLSLSVFVCSSVSLFLSLSLKFWSAEKDQDDDRMTESVSSRVS